MKAPSIKIHSFDELGDALISFNSVTGLLKETLPEEEVLKRISKEEVDSIYPYIFSIPSGYSPSDYTKSSNQGSDWFKGAGIPIYLDTIPTPIPIHYTLGSRVCSHCNSVNEYSSKFCEKCFYPL